MGCWKWLIDLVGFQMLQQETRPCLYLVAQYRVGGQRGLDGCPLQDNMKLGYSMDPSSLYPRYRTQSALFEILAFCAPVGTSEEEMVHLEAAWFQEMDDYRIRAEHTPMVRSLAGVPVFVGGTELFRTAAWGYCTAIRWAEMHCGPKRNLVLEMLQHSADSEPLVAAFAATIPHPDAPTFLLDAPTFRPDSTLAAAVPQFCDSHLSVFASRLLCTRGSPGVSGDEHYKAVLVDRVHRAFEAQTSHRCAKQRFARLLFRHFNQQALDRGFSRAHDWLSTRKGNKRARAICAEFVNP